jgi:hypothetical protein
VTANARRVSESGLSHQNLGENNTFPISLQQPHEINFTLQFGRQTTVPHESQMNIRQTLKKNRLIYRLLKPTYPARFAMRIALLFLYDYMRYQGCPVN